jgi:hypothetical protein
MEPVIRIEATHSLVLLADEIDWTAVTERVEVVREKKLKSAAGRPPHLRALIGAVLLKATRDIPGARPRTRSGTMPRRGICAV